MADLPNFEALLVDNLALIDRAVRALARRYGMSPDDGEELRSWVRLRIVEDEYQVLRRFRGDGPIGTYLTVVVAMLARDYRHAHWGRWRPSTEARRRGGVAVRLETLVYRDGCPLEHAGQALRTAGETTLSDRQLASLLFELPVRRPLRPLEMGGDALDSVAAETSPADGTDADARDQAGSRAKRELDRALEQLPVEDRTIVKMRFWSNSSVAEIARGLGLDQKPLYRRLERLLAQLRDRLTEAGIDRDALNDLLS